MGHKYHKAEICNWIGPHMLARGFLRTHSLQFQVALNGELWVYASIMGLQMSCSAWGRLLHDRFWSYLFLGLWVALSLILSCSNDLWCFNYYQCAGAGSWAAPRNSSPPSLIAKWMLSAATGVWLFWFIFHRIKPIFKCVFDFFFSCYSDQRASLTPRKAQSEPRDPTTTPLHLCQEQHWTPLMLTVPMPADFCRAGFDMAQGEISSGTEAKQSHWRISPPCWEVTSWASVCFHKCWASQFCLKQHPR